MHRPIALTLLLPAAAACSVAEPRVESAAQPLIQDAVHGGGRAGFYFLPPLVPATPLPPAFDASLTLTARFEGPGLSASFPLAVDAAGQLYRGDVYASGLDPDALYRVRVLSGTLELGFADVRVYEGHVRNLATNDEFELVEGRKLNVKVYVNRCAAVTCPADACHAPSTCEPATGKCTEGAPVVCDDGDACTADACQPDTGCAFTPIPRFGCARWGRSYFTP